MDWSVLLSALITSYAGSCEEKRAPGLLGPAQPVKNAEPRNFHSVRSSSEVYHKERLLVRNFTRCNSLNRRERVILTSTIWHFLHQPVEPMAYAVRKKKNNESWPGEKRQNVYPVIYEQVRKISDVAQTRSPQIADALWADAIVAGFAVHLPPCTDAVLGSTLLSFASRVTFGDRSENAPVRVRTFSSWMRAP